MRVGNILVAAALLLSGTDSRPTADTQQTYGNQVLGLQAKGLLNLVNYIAKSPLINPKCNLGNVAVRKEWSNISKKERKEYINAILCLAKKKPLTPASLNTGVRSRYDDFVLTHINNSFTIHGTGNFLVWHRYYTWAFEKALRDECGYKGYAPYMDWGKYAMDPLHSPIFDGSDTSMSGDGAYVQHDPVGVPSNDAPSIVIPPAQGGGCITSGPFVNFKSNLGPCFPSLKYVEPNPFANCTGYNPRCIRRDISQWTSSRWTKDSDTADLLLNYADPTAWINRFQGDFPSGYMGVHGGGHFTWGGDPGGDFMNSPGDPVFWLHHANVDRVFWIWQNLDIVNRLFAVGGTITINNFPPSRNTSLDDTIDMGILAPARTIRQLSNTLGGPFCYIYA